MWPSRVGCLAALLCLVAGMAQAQTMQAGLRCPPFLDNRALDDVRVFSGPPANRVEDRPRPGGWDFGPTRPGIDPPMTLLCRYAGDGPTLTVVLPPESTACAFTASTWPHVVCR
jgi:hypothetical protein